MAELAAIRVLNVLRSYEKQVETPNGIKKTEHHIVFSVEGGQLDVLFDPSIDIPVGWSGRALIEVYARTSVFTSKNGKPYEKTYLNAYRVINFDKGFKHPELSQIIPQAQK